MRLACILSQEYAGGTSQPLTPSHPMKTTMKNRISIGCYIDGANQNSTEGSARVVRLSESFGRELDRETLNFCLRVELDVATERDYELEQEFSDEAEEWLNEHATIPFAYWSWEDGVFGLWPSVENAKDGCCFVSVRSLRDAKSMGIETDPEDSEYPPADFRGEWLHVNDHGNCTLYVRDEAGNDSEIWSIV